MVGIYQAGLPIVLLSAVSTRYRPTPLVHCVLVCPYHPRGEVVRPQQRVVPALATVHQLRPISAVLLKGFSLQCTIFEMSSSHGSKVQRLKLPATDYRLLM